MEMNELLRNKAEAFSISLDDRMISNFSVFYEMLIEKNKYMNLTAVTEKEDVVSKHFLDSMSLAKFYDLSGQSIIDIGTGAGFPGIPLAILCPDANFVLMDSLRKRLLFIDTVLEACGLDNVTLLHGRAEDYGKDKQYREKFDFCISRAVAPLPVLLEFCTPFVKVGGRFISYKSEQFTQELLSSENAMSVLNCNFEKEISYVIPETGLFRVLGVFDKKGRLDKKFPRQAGRPKKSPL